MAGTGRKRKVCFRARECSFRTFTPNKILREMFGRETSKRTQNGAIVFLGQFCRRGRLTKGRAAFSSR